MTKWRVMYEGEVLVSADTYKEAEEKARNAPANLLKGQIRKCYVYELPPEVPEDAEKK